MPRRQFGGSATASLARIEVGHNLAQMIWVVTQISVGTSPYVPGSSLTMSLNGVYVSSTAIGSADAAVGPPPLEMYAGDLVSLDWSGVPATTILTAIVFFSENPVASLPRAYGGQMPDTPNVY